MHNKIETWTLWPYRPENLDLALWQSKNPNGESVIGCVNHGQFLTSSASYRSKQTLVGSEKRVRKRFVEAVRGRQRDII